MKKFFLIIMSVLGIILVSCNNGVDSMGENVNVIILSGQSNCSGYTYNQYLYNNAEIDDERKEQLINGFSNVLIHFSNNLPGRYNLEFEPVTSKMGDSNEQFGIELGVAEYFYNHHPNEKIYIIKFALGGSSLHQNWASQTSSLGAKPLYKDFIAYVKNSLSLLMEQGLNPIIQGMCWMQGESDAIPNIAQSYYSLEKSFINDVKREFKDYISDNGMVFIDAEISDSPIWESYQIINQAKSFLLNEGITQHLIKTQEEKLTYNLEPYHQPDIAHFDSYSMLKLGRLFAEALDEAVDF